MNFLSSGCDAFDMVELDEECALPCLAADTCISPLNSNIPRLSIQGLNLLQVSI